MRSIRGWIAIALGIGSMAGRLSAQAPIITTYVGPGMPEMGMAATSQPIDGPRAVMPDGAGGFYIVSWSHNRIYRVSSGGTLALVAGTGTYGFSGDGGPATAAELAYPSGITRDAFGNLFIADADNNRIRKITPDGIIRTVAGNGVRTFSGDGGPATSASFSGPSAVAIDSAGALLIADTYNHRIRRVTADDVITTIAGSGTAGFSGDGGDATAAKLFSPSGLALDADGNVIIADTYNSRIRKIQGGTITTVAGGNFACCSTGDGGPATLAYLFVPYGVAVDTQGNLLIADTLNDRIRKVTPDGIIATLAGGICCSSISEDGGTAAAAALWQPTSVAVDGAGILIADSANSRIRRINTSNNNINIVAGSGPPGFVGDGGSKATAQLAFPQGVAVDAAGNLFIADSHNGRVRKVTPGGVISTVASDTYQALLATDNAGNVYIGDYQQYSIYTQTDAGVQTTIPLPFALDDGSFVSGPVGMAFDSAGNLYIAYRQNVVVKRTPDGRATRIAGTTQNGFSGDGGPATSAKLSQPTAVAVDASGNVFILDSGNRRIRRVNPQGIITTVAGGGPTCCLTREGVPATSIPLISPSGIAVDSTGNLYIADANKVRKVSLAGIISAVAGRGQSGYSGDGGPATAAELSSATAVTVDGSGNLFIADAYNNRIRKVTPGGAAPVISTISPESGTPGSNLSAVIAGSNLTGATTVTISGTGVTAAITGGSDSSLVIVLTLDPDADLGARTLTVTTAADVSGPLTFSVVSGAPVNTLAAPVTNELSADPPGLSQTVAPLYGGSFILTVNGLGFMPGSMVSVGASNLATTFVDSTRLTALVTTNALSTAGTLNVVVTNPGGLVSSALPLRVVAHGDLNASDSVNIGDALTLARAVGGLTSPAIPVTVGDLNLNGSVTIADALNLALFSGEVNTNFPLPTVTSVNPVTVAPGAALTITGTGFTPTTSDLVVLFLTNTGTSRVTPTSATATSINVSVPLNAVSGPLRIYRRDVALSSEEFPLPVAGSAVPLLLASISPFSHTAVGASVELKGTGFAETIAGNTVTFKSASGTTTGVVTAASSTRLDVTLPNEAICGPVTVTTGGQTSNARIISPQGLECGVQLVHLSEGGPGDVIVLEGSGFDFAAPANNIVSFSATVGTVSGTVVAASRTQLQVRVPQGATSGSVKVTVANQTSNGLNFHP